MNPTYDDEIIGSIRKLKTEDWFVFIASQIEKSFLKPIETDYSKIINESYKKGIKFENHALIFSNNMDGKLKKPLILEIQGRQITSINDLRISIQ